MWHCSRRVALTCRNFRSVVLPGSVAAGVAVDSTCSTSACRISRCDVATVSATAPTCSVFAKLKEKLSVCSAKKIDQKLAAVHAAEKRLLDMMPANTPYEVADVRVHVDGFGARCSLIEPETEFTVHTVIVGAEHTDKPPIVLVHGFMMGAGSFWKLLPELARERTVYAIDIIGMAGSSRPPFDATALKPQDIEELLSEPFERWAEALQLKNFVLLGHSFGGLVSSYWAMRHPERIACLGLLSPCLGFSDERISRFTGDLKNPDTPWQRRAWFSVIESIWSNHITPQTLVRWVPGFKGWLGGSNERRFKTMASGITDEEGRLLSKYVIATMDTPQSTEAAGPALFEPFLRPIEVQGETIKSRLAQLTDVPMFAIYGDHDWMEMPPQSDIPQDRKSVV